MRAHRIVLWLVVAQAAPAGCLYFSDPGPGTACRASSPELTWLNRPAAPSAMRVPHPYDRSLADPALSGGVLVGGDLEFRLAAPGRQLVEVFLAVPAELNHGYVLEAGGAVLDARYRARTGPDRLRPRRGWRHITLLGMLEGETLLRVRSEAPRYLLACVRWTAEETFENELVPSWHARAAQWAAGPFLPGEAGRTRRRDYLEQLADRLAFSRRPEVRRQALLDQTRAAYWLAAENHEPRDLERLDELFRAGLRLMPQESLLRQMISSACLGINAPAERMPQGPYCAGVPPEPWPLPRPPAPPAAPAWAVEQDKLAARAEAITRWWVRTRQQPNGELGGGWGDDVEILRQWAPLALGLGSETALEGIRRVADGLWSSGVLSEGYDRQISDVEHSSEPSTDTVPLRVAILPEDPEGLARLKLSAACAENWIVPQSDGRWRFRGAWFNCRQFDPKPERALDVHLNTRAMGPALWYAALTQDPKMIGLIARWAESWAEAMRSGAHGKPPGIFPPALRSADGAYLIGSPRWDQPAAEWDYYQWSGEAQEALTSLLLAVHDLTGEPRWLEAAAESFRIFERCPEAEALCREIRRAPAAFYEWRRRSGDARYDRAFGFQARPSRAALLERLAELARQTEARLAVNFAMYTSEVIYTDRVYYRWPAEYRWYLFGGEGPRGDRYPSFALTWPPAEGRFARAVLEAGPEGLELQLYNFEPRRLAVPLRVWRLRPGLYRWAGGEVRIHRRPQLIRLPLPAQREITVKLTRVGD